MANVKGLENATVTIFDGEGNEIATQTGVRVGTMEGIEVNSIPWYRNQKHYEITPLFSRSGIKAQITVLPAGEVWVLSRRIKRKQEALKYVKHSKRKQRLIKQLTNLSSVYAVCNLHEVGLKEAIEMLRGQK
jgi:hypothetical protein